MSAAKRKKTGHAEDALCGKEPILGASSHTQVNEEVIHEEKPQVKKYGNGAISGEVWGATSAEAGVPAVTPVLEETADVGDPVTGQSQVVGGRGEVQSRACEETGADAAGDKLGNGEVKSIQNLKDTSQASSSTDADENYPAVPQEETGVTEALLRSSVTDLPATPRQSLTVNGAASYSAEDSDSDISDAIEQGHVGPGSTPELKLDLRPTVKENIKRLYTDINTNTNTNKIRKKVYPVTRTRGRVLIINNIIFSVEHMVKSKECLHNRHGAEIDYKNLQTLFETLGFDVAKTEEDLSDLTAEEIYKELSEETQREEHINLGMFVLVIMSHGGRGDIIYDRNGLRVDLRRIMEYLTASRFPAMAGKPKFVIVNACSGERNEYGNSRESDQPGPALEAEDDEAYKLYLPPSNLVPGRVEHLDAGDFLFLKSCEETYVNPRMRSSGTWFIRILVATFYKHARHTDLETLCHVVRERVRKALLEHFNETNDKAGAAIPTHTCSFTNFRKLYLFPKYHPP